MFVLNVYFCCELRFVATYAPNSEIQELTQILLRISEEKFGGWSLWSGQVSNEVLSFYILQYMFRLLSSIWEMCKNTWPSLGTQLLLRQTDLDSDFAQTIWAKICWVGALLCTFIIFQSVHQRPAKCPPVSESVQFRTICETAKSRLFYNGGKRFNWFMSCDDQFLQAQASFRTSESSTSLKLPNLQE